MSSRLVLSIVAMGLAVPALYGQTAAAPSVPSAPSPLLTYEGRLLEAGVPVTGQTSFVFTILQPGGAAVWTSGPVSLAVSGGLYQIDLGGAGTPAIPPGILATPGLQLQVAVLGTVLSPNMDLVPTLQASAAFQLTGALAGDAGGSQNATELLMLQGFPLNLTSLAPAPGQVLAFNGASWVAGAPLPGPAGPAGPKGAVGPAGPAGPQGAPGKPGTAGGPGTAGQAGNVIWYGAGAPAGSLGSVGDFYLDSAASVLYGPKKLSATALGGWPSPGTPLAGKAGTAGAAGSPGPAGPAGAPGHAGPVGGQGPQGAAGPAGANGAQGAPGLAGSPGAAGATGAVGPEGSTLRSGSGDPASGNVTGAAGDYYLNTQNNSLYGPYASGWPATGLALVGPTGATGAAGAAGPAGSAGAQGLPGLPGPDGAQGLAGLAGPAGARGATGATGPGGATLRSGAGDPTSGKVTGATGDYYLDTQNSSLYGPYANGWPATGLALVGPQGTPGAAGAAGPAGSQGSQGPAGLPGPDGAQGGAGLAGPSGAPGAPGATGPGGATLRSGAGDPTSGNVTGATGDYYLNTANNSLYGPYANGWPGTGLALVGPQGAAGAAGAAGLAGSPGLQGPVGPAGADGVQGVAGLAGTPGAPGATGATGGNGSSLRSGVGDPTSGNATGASGDYYLNTASNMLYGPYASGWPAGVALVGAQGASGAAGSPGPAGSQGPQGAPGLAGVAGATGATGATGGDGSTLHSGTGNPATGNVAGAAGDYYLDDAANVLYGPYANGWPGTGVALAGPQGAAGAQGNPGPAGAQGPQGSVGLAGPQGAQGAAGAAGAAGTTILNGSAPPTSGIGANGSIYIDTQDATLYGAKSAGQWPAGHSLVGPQGPGGAAGSQGAAGPQGSAGPQGPQGSSGPGGAGGSTGPGGPAGPTGASVQNGNGAPANGTGAAGNFYVDDQAKAIYGPFANGQWPAGASLVGPAGAAGGNGQNLNLKQIALSKWYSISSGGENVANLYISPGNTDIYNQCQTMSFDGSLLWVVNNSNHASPVVYGINPLNGSLVKTISVTPMINNNEYLPYSCVSDGINLYVYMINGTGDAGPIIQEISIANGFVSNMGDFNQLFTGMYCSGNLLVVLTASAGGSAADIINTNSGSDASVNNGGDFYYSAVITPTMVILGGANGVYEYSRSGQYVTSSAAFTGPMQSLVYDGQYVWGTMTEQDPVTKATIGYIINKIDPNGLTVISTYPISHPASGSAFDGQNLWVVEGSANRIQMINPSNGSILSTLDTPKTPTQAVFDGTNVWVVNTGESVNTLTRY